MVRGPLLGYGFRSFAIMAFMSLSKPGFRVSCDATVSIMDGAVGARELDLAVRWGGAGYASLMHTATDFVCRLYVASEELRVRLRPRHIITRVNIPRVLLTLGGIMSALMSALMSASLTSILVFCFFQSGGASSSDSSLSQSSNIVRDTFEHAPESTDAAEAAESGGESSGADAAGGVCECAIAGGSCDNCCGAVIYWGSRGGGHGCKYL